MSLQLEKKPVEFDGKRYELACNMAALEALEGEYGGSMKAAFEDSVDHVSAKLFRIMLNQAREEAGEDPVEAHAIARRYNYAMIREMDVFGMFMRAMSPELAQKSKTEVGAGN